MNFSPLRALLVALVTLLGIWAGIRGYAHHTRLPLSTVSVPAGEASAPEVAFDTEVPLQAPKIPIHLPPFTLHDLLGKPTPISAWSGEALVINFWATWCAPCRREIPLLNSLATQWQGNGISFIGIAVDYPDKVREFATQFNIGYPLLVGEQDALDVAGALGMASPVFPFTVFSDRAGDIVTLFVGELHASQAALILATMHDLDQHRLDLPQARQQIASGLTALAAGNT